jgi:hypothetical protein
MKRFRPGSLLLLLPVLASAAGAYFRHYWLFAAALVLIPAVIALVPACRRFENMWAFILVFLTMPAFWIRMVKDMRLLLYFADVGELEGDCLLLSMCCGALSAAQLLVGAVVRRIWKRQRGFLKS